MRLEEETYGVVVDSQLYDSYLTISEAEELIEELGKGDLILMSEHENK